MTHNMGGICLDLQDLWIGNVTFWIGRYETSKIHRNGLKAQWSPRSQKSLQTKVFLMEILLVYSCGFDPGLLNSSTNDLKYETKS